MARFPGVRSSSIKGAASRLARPASHLSGDPISVVTKGGTLCFSTSAFCSISFRAGCTDRSPGGFNLMMWMTTDLQSQGVSPTVLRVPIENLNASCTNSFRFFLGSHAVYPALPEIALTRTNCGSRNVRRGHHRGRDRRDGNRGAAPGRGLTTVVLEAHGQPGGCAGFFRRKGLLVRRGSHHAGRLRTRRRWRRVARKRRDAADRRRGAAWVRRLAARPHGDAAPRPVLPGLASG